jgi:site-specific DNA-methyltransferase (adenine-specific)
MEFLMKRPWVCLVEGDCLSLMRAIPEGSVDLVLCDPPYGVTACAWDHKLPLQPLWEEYQRVVKTNGVIGLFAQQPFAAEIAASAPAGLMRYEWVWDKGCVTGFGNVRRMPLRRHENVLVFYRRQPTYNPQGLRRCRPRTRGAKAASEVYRSNIGGDYVQRWTGYPQTIIAFKRERGAKPCQKPVALLEYLIRTYTQPGETVLDNTMGTGSTGVAAIQCGRSFLGIELDHERFEEADDRISEAMRKHGKCRARTWFGGIA